MFTLLGRHDIAEQVGHIRVALENEILLRDHVYRDQGFGHGPGSCSPANHNQAFKLEGGLLKSHIRLARFAVGNSNLPGDQLITDESKHHLVGTGGKVRNVLGASGATADSPAQLRQAHLRAGDGHAGRRGGPL